MTVMDVRGVDAMDDLDDLEAGRAAVLPARAVAQLAHDLNNALATVSGYAQLLEGQPDFPSHLAHQLQALSHDADRAVSLVAQLLELAHQAEASGPAAFGAAPSSSTSDAPLPIYSADSMGFASPGASTSNGLGAGHEVLGEGAEILVVDDEEPIITLIAEVLGMDGHRVTPAFNGAEALAWTQMKKFDLIISDVRMPAVGGPAFYEILQSERPDLLGRVLFVTGDTVSLSTRQFLAGTQRPVLPKPFDPDRLRDIVRTTLAVAS